MIDRNEKTVIPFAPGSKGNVRVDGVPVDESGRAIIALLKDAADIARATCTQAINAAQKASSQLRAAEDRIKELESRFGSTTIGLRVPRSGLRVCTTRLKRTSSDPIP